MIKRLKKCFKVNASNVIKDNLDHFKEKFDKTFTDFFVEKVKSGSGTIITGPDLTWSIKFRIRPEHCLNDNFLR
jgi:hypothetical protein